MNNNQQPLAFGQALNQNTEAMIHYAAMSEAQQQAIRNKAQGLRTKEEMYTLVAQIANGTV